MSMFGALNRFISRLDGQPQVQKPSSIADSFGFQVLKNNNDQLPIEPWFDFVVGINGHDVGNGDSNLFTTEVRNCAGISVELRLWSAKGQRTRSIYVPVPSDSPSLGLALQWSSLEVAEDVWHILDVTPNSPADFAGLLPYGDYVIGTPECLLKGESALGELVEEYLLQPLRLYVYNHEYNVTRLVTIEPSRSWGGSGALGCVLGYGALHRIPPPLDEPPQDPGETLFETARMSSDVVEYPDNAAPADPADQLEDDGPPQLLIPAEMNFAKTSTPPPPAGTNPSDTAATPKPSTARRTRVQQHHHSHPPMDMDAYLQEGEAKSREQDGAPSTKSGSNIAPPPKAGPKPTEKSD